jgi:hypothetical protein
MRKAQIPGYEPAGYKPYVHPAAHCLADFVAATEDLAVFGESDDGYNHYTTRRHRDEYSPRHRGDYTPRRFHGDYRAQSGASSTTKFICLWHTNAHHERQILWQNQGMRTS